MSEDVLGGVSAGQLAADEDAEDAENRRKLLADGYVTLTTWGGVGKPPLPSSNRTAAEVFMRDQRLFGGPTFLLSKGDGKFGSVPWLAGDLDSVPWVAATQECRRVMLESARTSNRPLLDAIELAVVVARQTHPIPAREGEQTPSAAAGVLRPPPSGNWRRSYALENLLVDVAFLARWATPPILEHTARKLRAMVAKEFQSVAPTQWTSLAERIHDDAMAAARVVTELSRSGASSDGNRSAALREPMERLMRRLKTDGFDIQWFSGRASSRKAAAIAKPTLEQFLEAVAGLQSKRKSTLQNLAARIVEHAALQVGLSKRSAMTLRDMVKRVVKRKARGR